MTFGHKSLPLGQVQAMRCSCFNKSQAGRVMLKGREDPSLTLSIMGHDFHYVSAVSTRGLLPGDYAMRQKVVA